jgi:hypothetical protein
VSTWSDAQAKGVAVLDPSSWHDDGDAYTLAGVSRPAPTGPPAVTGTTPSTFAHTAPPTELLVQGSDFTPDCRVSFGGATPPTSFHDDTELAIQVNPGDWSAGTFQVMVAYSSRGPSNAVPFTVT